MLACRPGAAGCENEYLCLGQRTGARRRDDEMLTPDDIGRGRDTAQPRTVLEGTADTGPRVHADENRLLVEQQREHRIHLVEAAADMRSHVENERLRILVVDEELPDRGDILRLAEEAPKADVGNILGEPFRGLDRLGN